MGISRFAIKRIEAEVERLRKGYEGEAVRKEITFSGDDFYEGAFHDWVEMEASPPHWFKLATSIHIGSLNPGAFIDRGAFIDVTLPLSTVRPVWFDVPPDAPFSMHINARRIFVSNVETHRMPAKIAQQLTNYAAARAERYEHMMRASKQVASLIHRSPSIGNLLALYPPLKMLLLGEKANTTPPRPLTQQETENLSWLTEVLTLKRMGG